MSSGTSISLRRVAGPVDCQGQSTKHWVQVSLISATRVATYKNILLFVIVSVEVFVEIAADEAANQGPERVLDVGAVATG